MSISHNKRFLAMTGLDRLNRELVVIINLEGFLQQKESKAPELVVKKISNFNILCMKFSPIDCEQLLTCGRENITFRTLKADIKQEKSENNKEKQYHLKNIPVLLNHHARSSVFTTLDFEFSYEDPSAAL